MGPDDDECQVCVYIYIHTYLGYTPQGRQFGYPTTRYRNSGGDCYWVGGRYRIYIYTYAYIYICVTVYIYI